jgi:hypothetical protein
MRPDRKVELRQLRDEFDKALISSLAKLKALGFSRNGRCWKRSHEHANGSATDIIQFEMTVLKASVRVRMYEMQWVETGLKTAVGRQKGRLETTHDRPEWNLHESADFQNVLMAVTNRLQRVSLPWFATGGDPPHASEFYSIDDFNPQNLL